MLPVFAALVVFLPVLQRPFVYDEFIHLYNLVNFGVAELLITPHGGHLLFFSNLVYWPLYKLFGLWASAYYTIALLTHLLNVALCYRVIVRFTGRPVVAAIAATLWGCAAVHLGSIGWFAVYGQLLLATILLWLLGEVAQLAAAGAVPSTRTAVWWAALLIAACGSFGYGLCIAALFFAVVTLMLDADASWRQILGRLAGSSLAVTVLYLAQQWLHAAVSGRAALYGVGGMLAGLGSLSWSDAVVFGHAILASAASGVGSLFTGSLVYVWKGQIVAGPPRGLSSAHADIGVWIAPVVWLATCAFWLRHRCRADIRKAVGLGVFALGCYAILAAHVATDRPSASAVEIVRAAGIDEQLLTSLAMTAPRYQYLPSLLLILATAVALPPSLARSRTVRAALRGGAMLWAAISVVLNGVTVHADMPLRDPQKVVESGLRREVGRFPPGSTVYVDNAPAPMAFPASSDDLLPGSAAIALLLFPQFFVDGHRVYFVEHDHQLLQQLRLEAETPIAHLILGDDEVPSDAYYVRSLVK